MAGKLIACRELMTTGLVIEARPQGIVVHRRHQAEYILRLGPGEIEMVAGMREGRSQQQLVGKDMGPPSAHHQVAPVHRCFGHPGTPADCVIIFTHQGSDTEIVAVAQPV